MDKAAINLPHILMLHNRYQYAGGEDACTEIETDLLRQAGHSVTLVESHNDRIKQFSKIEQLQLLISTAWNPQAYREMRSRLQGLRPDLLHVQNFFPLFSPSVHAAAQSLQIPTVQHLRNFRLACLNSYLLRDGKVCEACLGRNPWRGIVYRCYRDSLPASIGVWNLITFNRRRGTWLRDVDAFITPSQFAAEKLLQAGVPGDRLHIKPDAVADPLEGKSVLPLPEKPIFVFVGRLSQQKGVMTLLEAWRRLNQVEWQLDLVGEGDQSQTLRQFAQEKGLANVHFRGQLPRSQVLEIMQSATAVVVPSQSYETFGRSVIEAFACGRAALVSNLGGLAELVKDDQTGFVISHIDVDAWVERLQWSGDRPLEMARMGQQARQAYLQNYTPAINYHHLMAIYQGVLA